VEIVISALRNVSDRSYDALHVVPLVDGQIEARKEMRPTPPEELAKIANASLEDLEGSRV